MSGWIKISSGQVPPVEYDSHGDMDCPTVLIYSPKYPEQMLGRYRPYSKSWTFSGSNSDFTAEITHWMPLPETPKEI